MAWGLSAGARSSTGATPACDELGELGAVRLGIAAADPHERPRREPRYGRELGEHLIDRAVRRRGEEDALAAREQLADHVDECHRLARAGRAPHEREVTVGAQLDGRALARVERDVVEHERRGGPDRRVLAEQRHRERRRVDPVQCLQQASVEKPRRHDERAWTADVDGSVRDECEPFVVDALEGDELVAARGSQRARGPGREPLRRREREAVAEPAEILAAGERDLGRLRGRAHRLQLALEAAPERRHEPGEQLGHRTTMRPDRSSDKPGDRLHD